MNEHELTGRARTHIVDLEQPRCALHYEVAAAFLAMRDAAARAGFGLAAASSFRDFDRQLHIWNAKWSGERALLDGEGRPLDGATLGDDARIAAILRWSALPGGTRHHWGSDVDVFDAAAAPPGYRVQLVPDEYAQGGVFAGLSAWLEANMARFGFFRPYASGHGGVGIEAWHLSYWPVANRALEALTLPVLRRAIAGSALLGRERVLERLPEIYTRFIVAVDSSAPAVRRAASRVA
jgi:LAS superfamily LD-carboxypeptidase LdcB